MSEQATFAGWAILELLGHRKLGGYLSEAQIGGASFIRIDVPAHEETDAGAETAAITQYYAPAAVYAITPVTEEVARAVAEYYGYQPVSRYEVPALMAPRREEYDPDPDQDERHDLSEMGF